MTTPGSDRPRRGFLAGLSERLTPPAIPDDDDPSKPLVVPTGIKVAFALALLGGLMYLVVGTASALSSNSQFDRSVDSYKSQLAECQTKVGGVGDQVMANPPADLADLASRCKTGVVYTDAELEDMRSKAVTYNVLLSVVVALMGVAAIASGWYLRVGAKWAKRVLIGVIVLAFAGTLLFGIAQVLWLLATLFIAVSLMMSIIGKGGQYFAMVAARRATR